jgi:hypothetical protein
VVGSDERHHFESSFPNLKNTFFEIISPPDKNYNCVAWAMGINDGIWWPDRYNQYYWPDPKRENTMEGFIRAFQSLGFEVTKSRIVEDDYEKIAIYGNEFGPHHVARQLPDGKWTSKCGDEEDIIHELNGLEDSISYGQVIIVMKKHR